MSITVLIFFFFLFVVVFFIVSPPGAVRRIPGGVGQGGIITEQTSCLDCHKDPHVDLLVRLFEQDGRMGRCEGIGVHKRVLQLAHLE